MDSLSKTLHSSANRGPSSSSIVLRFYRQAAVLLSFTGGMLFCQVLPERLAPRFPGLRLKLISIRTPVQHLCDIHTN